MGDSFFDDLSQKLRALGAPFEVVAGGALFHAASEFGDKPNPRSAYLVDSRERVVVGELVAPSSIRVWNNLAAQKWAKFGEEIGEIDLSVWPPDRR
jgi:hypothetical protein